MNIKYMWGDMIDVDSSIKKPRSFILAIQNVIHI